MAETDKETEADRLMATWTAADARVAAALADGDVAACDAAMNEAVAAMDRLEALYPDGPPDRLYLKYIEPAGST